MINILLEGYNIDAPWLYNELKKYIQPNHSVAVVAFSFRDNRVKSLSDWNALYDKKLASFITELLVDLLPMVSSKKTLFLLIILPILRKPPHRRLKMPMSFISLVACLTK